MNDLKMMILEAGAISDKEVQWIVEAVKRYGINETTARFLLDVNNLLSEQHPVSFRPVFVQTLKAFVLDSGTDISAAKWDWLKQNLLKDQVIDDLERELLAELRTAATAMPDEMRNFAI